MNRYIIWVILIISCNARSFDINDELQKMDAGEEFISNLDLNDKLKIEVILDKTVRGNGTVLIGNTLLKVKDSASDDGWTYENDYLDIQLSDINMDGRKEVIVSGIAKKIDQSKKGFKLFPITYIYEYSVRNKRLLELYRNSPIEIDLTKI